MLDKIKVFKQSGIKISDGSIIYFDPIGVDNKYMDADIIFITHSHSDHFSIEDIIKVMNSNTKIVVPSDLPEKLTTYFQTDHIYVVKPNMNYTLNNINFRTIPAYNVNSNHHPRSNDWVGYLVRLNNITYYIAGDTDITLENSNLKCDVAFVPIGGKFTMNDFEAAKYINMIKPRLVIPTHYGMVVGDMVDAQRFKEGLNPNIKCEIIIKEPF